MSKLYCFDLDDNLIKLNNYIYLKDNTNNKIVKFSTDDFAHLTQEQLKNEYSYFSNSFIEFSEEKDDLFFENFKKGIPKKSMKDLVECINNAYLFSIITARGHSIEIIKKAFIWLIENEKFGIKKEKLLKNMKKNFNIQNIEDYIKLCKFYPVNNSKIIQQLGGNEKTSTGILKTLALNDFILYTQKLFNNKKLSIGFSDDDIKNLENVKEFFMNYDKNLFNKIVLKQTKGSKIYTYYKEKMGS